MTMLSSPKRRWTAIETCGPSPLTWVGPTTLAVWPYGRERHTGLIRVGNEIHPCALGRSGITALKREGDGASPLGIWPVRRVFHRHDRWGRIAASLPVQAIRQQDGWSDDPAMPDYNRRVALPYPASHETLWRSDHLYDVFLELGYNDAPPRAGRGSAIFLHLARPGYLPTEGCVAVSSQTMRHILRIIGPGSRVEIRRRL